MTTKIERRTIMELTPLKVHMEDNNLKHGSLLKLFRERIFFVKLDAKILLEKIEGYGDDKKPIKNDFELSVKGYLRINKSHFFALAGPDRYTEIDNFSSHDIDEICYNGGRSHLELLDSGEVTCSALKYTKPQCYNIEDILVGQTRPKIEGDPKRKTPADHGRDGAIVGKDNFDEKLEPFLSEIFTLVSKEQLNNLDNLIKNDLYPICEDYLYGNKNQNRKRLLKKGIKTQKYVLAEKLLEYLKENICNIDD